MNIKPFIQKLGELNACTEAKRVIRHYKTSQEWWDDTGRGDWQLWLTGKLSGEPGNEKRKKLVLTACKCARTTLKHVPECETRPLRAIETAEAWANNTEGVSLQDVRAAAAAAAAYDATYDAAYAAAYDAAYAAYAAAAAAYAAYDTAAATAAAYAAAYAAYAADAGENVLSQCADIVREAYPNVDDLFKD